MHETGGSPLWRPDLVPTPDRSDTPPVAGNTAGSTAPANSSAEYAPGTIDIGMDEHLGRGEPDAGSLSLARPKRGPDTPGQAPSAAPEVAAAARYKQIHYIGSAVLNGDHPDPGMQERVAALISQKEAERARLDSFIAATHDYNDAHAATIAVARSYLRDDFGTHLAESPLAISVLDPEAFRVACALMDYDGNPSTVQGMAIHGRILINRTNDMARSNTQFVATLLHEGVHLAMGDDARMIVTQPPIPALRLPANVFATHDSPFTQPDAEAGGWQTGAFWREGLAESYRVKTMGRVGLPTTAHDTRHHTLSDGTQLALIASDNQYITNLTQGCVGLPIRYAEACAPGGRHKYILPTAALAARGIDLLDSQLGGVVDDMFGSRHDPAAKQRFVAKVNGVRPELYRELGRLPYSATGFLRGLERIIQVLHLENHRA